MKYIILTITFCTLFLGANAQETIELDGMKIKKSILKPGKEIKLNAKEYKTNGKHGVDSMHKNKKPWSVKVAVSKNRKAYVQSIFYESENNMELASSSLKYFDEKGNKKWEKNLKDRASTYSYLSDDGKHWIMHMVNLNHEVDLSTNSLLVFNDQGEIVLEVDSLADMRVAASKDLICYKRETDLNENSDDINEFYCYDMKNNKIWRKAFKEKVYVDPASLNGDFIIAYLNNSYILYNRNGNEIMKTTSDVFEGGVSVVSNDGKYAICNRSAAVDTSYFLIYNLKNFESTKTNYFKIPEINSVVGRGYNGEAFVNQSKYIVALTSIIAPYTATVVFHDIDGTYLGHKVYKDIQSSFSGPDITLQNDGSFEVYVDGYYLGNLVLPNVNTLKYLKK
ncbi:MAG: hypothetical protein PF436_12605 [Prolixibacteraceae bacterium]|jgi:hypothetical protein|nr:hypothetical protein [Prolixibacteraceae bacterium]